MKHENIRIKIRLYFHQNETWKMIATVAHGGCCSAPEWQTGLAIVSHTVKQIISCFETIWAVNCRSLSPMPDGLDFQRIVSIGECNFEVAPWSWCDQMAWVLPENPRAPENNGPDRVNSHNGADALLKSTLAWWMSRYYLKIHWVTWHPFAEKKKKKKLS